MATEEDEKSKQAIAYLETAAITRAIERLRRSTSTLDRIDLWVFERMLQKLTQGPEAAHGD